ncbi:bifunctional UDP-sugar hydrolase/5'-nucleotidase [uncultured Nocardioides sp.]|uniref:bifunctional metallophosphatase/5'-nucleotidase n=1 Tax=uncultured Nocardioides sp. TaxID=198441 RepID=UPI0026231739|nr:bifunctional UDP-sugar hydrolase/5'-nucleotidase [uncultured Nocardioides sp.]
MHSRSGSSTLRVRAAALGLGLAVAATSATVVVQAPAAHAAETVSISLLNINDFHGRIDANTTKFATTVEQIRAEKGESNTLFISAGDNIGASLFASNVADDEPTIDVLNALDLASSAVGNHEFDKGLDDLEGRVADRADWNYLGANVYEKGTDTPALEEYDLLEVAGVTVGIIGAVTEETPTLVAASGVADVDFGDPVEAVNRVAEQLSDGDEANGEADVIVAEYHEGATAGTPDGATLEEEIAAGGAFADIVTQTHAEVDAIFTGHTHKQYVWDAPIPGGEGTRPVVQTGSYGENIGVIDLAVDLETGAVMTSAGENVARVAEEDLTFPRVAEVKLITDEALANAELVGNQPVGEITGDITTAFGGGSYVDGEWTGGGRDDRASESAMGHLVAQALLDGLPFGEPDLGLTNPGGLRAEFYFEGDPTENPANTDGVVTYAEANSVLPFGNTIVTAELTGADLIQVFDQQWQTAETPEDPTPSRPYLALGASDNVEVVADPTAETGEHIVSLKIDGEEVDPEATYSVATFNFLAEGNDNFRAFRNATVTDSGISDAELFRDYLADSSPIEPDHAQRQMFVDTDGELTAGTTETIEVTRLGLTSLGSPVDPSVTVTAGEQELGTFPVTDRAATIELELPESLGGQSITLTSALGVTAELAVAAPEPTAVVKAKRNPKGPLKAGKKKLKVTVKVKVDGEPASGKVVLSGAGVDKKVKLNKKGKAVTRVGPFDERGVQVITVSYGDASDILRFKVR